MEGQRWYAVCLVRFWVMNQISLKDLALVQSECGCSSCWGGLVCLDHWFIIGFYIQLRARWLYSIYWLLFFLRCVQSRSGEYPLSRSLCRTVIEVDVEKLQVYACPCTKDWVPMSLPPSPTGPSLSVATLWINTVCSTQMALSKRMCNGIICHWSRILGHGRGISKAHAIGAKPVCNPVWGGKRRHIHWCTSPPSNSLRKCLSFY